MASGQRLRSLIVLTVFTVPFALIGLALLVMGIRDRNILAALFGAVFFGFPVAGPLKDWLDIGKSQERLAAGRRGNLLRTPEPPALPDGPTGYRSLARIERTETIALDKLPLPSIPRSPGKSLPHALAATGVTLEVVLSHTFLLVFGGSVLAQVFVLFKQQSAVQILCLVGFTLATLFLYFFAQGTRRELRLRPVVEVSAEPATTGQRLDIHVRLPAGLRTQALDIAIVCEEIAVKSTSDGNTTHTEELHRQTLWSGPVAGGTWSKEVRGTLPKRTPPSFDLGSNRVQWSVEIGFREPDGERTKRQIPFRVLPKAPPGVPLDKTGSKPSAAT
jgi:hypothetical protein